MNINWYHDIFNWYQSAFWSEEMVANAVFKGKITKEEQAKILAGEEGAH